MKFLVDSSLDFGFCSLSVVAPLQPTCDCGSSRTALTPPAWADHVAPHCSSPGSRERREGKMEAKGLDQGA